MCTQHGPGLYVFRGMRRPPVAFGLFTYERVDIFHHQSTLFLMLFRATSLAHNPSCTNRQLADRRKLWERHGTSRSGPSPRDFPFDLVGRY